MGRSHQWVLCSFLLLWVVSACASAPRVGPTTPTASLERADWLVWHSLRHFLQRDDVRAAGVSAVCVGLGEDGRGIPSPELVGDFAEADPPVVPAARCSRSAESGWSAEGAPPGPAAFLSFFDVEATGAWMVSVRLELPGEDVAVERCTLSAGAERRTIVSANQPPTIPPARPMPRTPSVNGC